MNEEEIDKKIKESWQARNSNPASDGQKKASWKKFQAERFPQQKPKKWYYGIAASFLVIAATLTGVFFQKNKLATTNTSAYQIIENPTTHIKTIFLPDSSKVNLAANAQLSFPENFKTHRNVELKGEAVFEVKKDSAHPFTVKSQLTTTRVLGTIFKVKNLSAKHTEVNLYEGSVQMQVEGRDKNWIIAPGEVFVLKNDAIDIESFELFKEFKEAPLKDFVTYIQKNYGFELVFPDDISNKKITLKLNRQEPLEHIVAIVTQLYQYNYQKSNTDQKIYFATNN